MRVLKPDVNISIVIPCYNGEPFIAQTIGSALEQSYPPAEVIVVDDGSADESARIARSFGEPVKVISKRCGGASHARNYGYRYATGEAVMFLDADDVLGPDALANLTGALSEEGIAICPWHRLAYENGRWVSGPADCKPLRSDRDYLANWLTGWWHPPCSVLWSRSAFERTGGWDQRAYVNDDGELIMRALVHDTPLSLSAAGTAYYRRSPDDETSISDRRFTRAGIQSRIYAARKIAVLLEQENKIPKYRQPLRAKFEEIAEDCAATFPDLYNKCLRYADQYGSSHWVSTIRNQATSIVRENLKPAIRGVVPTVLKNRLKRLEHKVTGAAESPRLVVNHESDPYGNEIRYGLMAASETRTTEQRTSDDLAGLSQLTPPSDPTVSIIIPTYNRASCISRALDSALSQTFQDFEILVIDDGSTDNTYQVIEGYDDSRIRYLAHSENRGVAAARNFGMREATGAFIAFLDSDDEWFPHKLEKQLQCFRRASADVGLVYCGVKTVENDGEEWIFSPSHRGTVYEDLLLDNIIHSGSGTIIRRDVIPAIGFFNGDIPAHEDYDYWLRISRFYQFDYVDEPLLRYYNGSGMGRKTLDTTANVKARHWFYRKYCSEMREADVDYLFLVETARWHLIWAHDRLSALLILLGALAKSPLRREGYHLLPRIVLPTRVYHLIRKHVTSAA